MDPQFEEAVGRITKDVVGAVSAHFTEVVTATERRLSGPARTNLDAVLATLTAAERRLSERAKTNLEAVATALTAAARRLADQAVINVEAVKSEAKLAAEGYAGTLESIERRLGRLEGALGSKFTDYDAVLKDHGDTH